MIKIGRLFYEHDNTNQNEGLNGYIKEKEQDIIFKWQNEKKSIIRKRKREETNEKVQKV